MDKKIVIALVAIIAVAAVGGALLFTNQPGGEQATKTYIIIGYYWGFALYDGDFNPVDKIELKVGEPVKIIFLNARSFAPEFYEPLEQRTIEQGLGAVSGDALAQKIMEALETNQVDHGLQITGLKVAIATNYKAFSGTAKSLAEFFEKEPQDQIEKHSVVITPERAGVYDLVCYVVCGYGHSFMILENAVVVSE